MSRSPQLDGPDRPRNLVALRGAFTALNDLVIPRLIRAGFTDLRTAHAAVSQSLDDTGTTVSVLAQRAHDQAARGSLPISPHSAEAGRCVPPGRNVALDAPWAGMCVLDVVNGRIVFVEVLYRGA